jgi:hypothetical protein
VCVYLYIFFYFVNGVTCIDRERLAKYGTLQLLYALTFVVEMGRELRNAE